jgi:hypothetical protein
LTALFPRLYTGVKSPLRAEFSFNEDQSISMLAAVAIPTYAIVIVLVVLFFAALTFKFAGTSVNIRIEPQGPGASGENRFGFTFEKLVQRTQETDLLIKCQCGAEWKFAEGTGNLPPDSQPIPKGDSFVCPKCGKTTDLRPIKNIQASAPKAPQSRIPS